MNEVNESLTVRVLSGCCPGAPMGRSENAKKQDARGVYYGCMNCKRPVERSDAAYQIRLMRRTLKAFGLRPVKRQ